MGPDLRSPGGLLVAAVCLLVALGAAGPHLRAQQAAPSGEPVPPTPPAPTSLTMPRVDPAWAPAHELAMWVQSRREARADAMHPRWSVEPSAVWSVRGERECLADLDAKGVPYRALTWTPSDRLPTPVSIEPPTVSGVRFQKTVPLPLIVSCELAARLPVIAEVLSRHGVREVEVVSAYRATPTSFHSVGMAIDLKSFVTDAGRITVEHGFRKTPDEPTCEAEPPPDGPARLLRDIACDLAATRRFSSVITPNYNEGHYDHFHLDIRPDDPRLFVR